MSPYWTHPLTALLRWTIVFVILSLLRVPGAEWFAFAYVAGYFEGREAGQREHDLKGVLLAPSTGPWSPMKAWAGSAFFFGWSLPNLAQAAAGIVPVLLVTVLAAWYGRGL